MEAARELIPVELAGLSVAGGQHVLDSPSKRRRKYKPGYAVKWRIDLIWACAPAGVGFLAVVSMASSVQESRPGEETRFPPNESA